MKKFKESEKTEEIEKKMSDKYLNQKQKIKKKLKIQIIIFIVNNLIFQTNIVLTQMLKI